MNNNKPMDNSMKNILRTLKQSKEDPACVKMSVRQDKRSKSPSPLNHSQNNSIQSTIQTHPLLINNKNSKPDKSYSTTESTSSESSRSIFPVKVNNQDNLTKPNENKLIRIIQSNPTKESSNSSYDDIREHEQSILNELGKSDRVHKNVTKEKPIRDKNEMFESNKQKHNTWDTLTKFSKNAFENQDQEHTDQDENFSKNNNNNRIYSRYFSPDNCCSQNPIDCNEPANTMSSVEVRKKFHRANKVFYNGFLNKQDKPSSLPEYQAHASELLHFLKSLWLTKTMCDLSIVANERKYCAHRLGLAMFSRKYRDEFQRQLQTKDSSMYTICLKNTTNNALEAILKYIYTAKIDINPSNVEELLAAANELGIDDLICMASDYLSSLSIGDVLDFMGNMFNKDGSELMLYELYSYIMTHLDKISRTPEYFKSSKCVVKALLSDSHLAVSSELEVFDAAIRWINFDRTSRLKYLAEIMNIIRFTQMRPDELVCKVESSCYFPDSFDFQKMVYNAYKFHALNHIKNNFNGIVHKEESRNFSLKGASVPDNFVKAVMELSDIAHKLKEARTYTTSNLMNYGNEDCQYETECKIRSQKCSDKHKQSRNNIRFCQKTNRNNHNNSEIISKRLDESKGIQEKEYHIETISDTDSSHSGKDEDNDKDFNGSYLNKNNNNNDSKCSLLSNRGKASKVNECKCNQCIKLF